MNSGMTESLENRRLMSITWVNNELTAVGSDVAEHYYYAAVRSSPTSTSYYFIIADKITGNAIESKFLASGSNWPTINKTTITANGGSDLVYSAPNGPMEVHGGEGNDTLWASNSNCSLYGEGGNDSLNGANGNDLLDGGTGTDVAHGGNGTDTFPNVETIFDP
jgi:hypothetical protein